MKVPQSSHLRRTLESLVRDQRIEKGDVEKLLNSPEELKAVLTREDAFDAPTQRAFDAVLGGADTKVETAQIPSAFSSKSAHSLLVGEKAAQNGGGWWSHCDASMPELFDTGKATEAMSVGSLAMKTQDLIDMLSGIGSDRKDWGGAPYVDLMQVIRNIR